MDKSTRKRVIRITQILISLVIVVGIFAFAIPKIANYGDVWMSVRIIALLALLVTGRTNAALIVPTVIGIGVLLIAIGLFAGMLWKEDMARAIGGGLGKAATFFRKWFRKPEVHWGNAAASFRKQTI